MLVRSDLDSGNLLVRDTLQLASGAHVAGPVAIIGDVSIDGRATLTELFVTDSAFVSGNVSMASQLSVAGDVNLGYVKALNVMFLNTIC